MTSKSVASEKEMILAPGMPVKDKAAAASKVVQPPVVAAAEVPAVRGEHAVAVGAESPSWGAIEDMETTDLLVPKIFHQQALSKFATDGVAKAGDFCDSLTGVVLAKRDEKLEVIIFGAFKTLLVSKLEPGSGKYKYERTITVVPENAREIASKPFMEEVDGESYRNNLTYNFYCLVPALINELPYVLSLGSTKTRAAKKINTMLYKLSQLKRPGASVVFQLSSVPEKNEQGSWFGLEVAQGRNATPEELLRAHAWYVKSKSQKFVVVEEEAAADAADDDTSF